MKTLKALVFESGVRKNLRCHSRESGSRRPAEHIHAGYFRKPICPEYIFFGKQKRYRLLRHYGGG